MRRRSRLVTAAALGLIGLATLGYYSYAVVVAQAYVGLFEALYPGHVQVGEPALWFRVLPYLGSLMVIGSLALFLAPALSRRFVRPRPRI